MGHFLMAFWTGAEFDKKVGHPTLLNSLIFNLCPALLSNFQIAASQE